MARTKQSLRTMWRKRAHITATVTKTSPAPAPVYKRGAYMLLWSEDDSPPVLRVEEPGVAYVGCPSQHYKMSNGDYWPLDCAVYLGDNATDAARVLKQHTHAPNAYEALLDLVDERWRDVVRKAEAVIAQHSLPPVAGQFVAALHGAPVFANSAEQRTIEVDAAELPESCASLYMRGVAAHYAYKLCEGESGLNGPKLAELWDNQQLVCLDDDELVTLRQWTGLTGVTVFKYRRLYMPQVARHHWFSLLNECFVNKHANVLAPWITLMKE